MRYLNFILAGILFFVTGCDILNQKPQTAIASEDAIINKKSADAALNGLYSELQSGDYYGSEIQIISGVTSDNSQSVGTWDFYREMDTYVTNPGNLENRNFWAQAYATINHANNIIAKVPDLDNVSQADKDRIMGQAYFIRGLAYFDLTKTFGGIPGVYGTKGVPIVTKPSKEVTYPSRSSLKDSYNQVESDLKEAESRLDGFNDPTRASEAAAKALLSRLYLSLRDYSNAEKYASEVINNYSFKLVEDFASIFIDEKTSSAIFELAFNSSDQEGLRNWWFPSSRGGRGDIALHRSFAKMVLSRPNDERGNLIGYDKNVGVYYPEKYQKASNGDNFQILRLAEMYLNRAEARAQQNDLNGALDDLNKIRNRAGLQDTTGTGVSNKDEVLGAIYHEENVEFFEEGHRWYDLLRTGRAMKVLQNIDRKNGEPVSLTDKGRRVFPIPAHDIDANDNIEQNDAYK